MEPYNDTGGCCLNAPGRGGGVFSSPTKVTFNTVKWFSGGVYEHRRGRDAVI